MGESNSLPVGHWPSRPQNELFPPLLDTVLVAQLLLYDRRGVTVQNARRDVRRLAKENGLPKIGKIGSTLMFKRDDVLAWIEKRGEEND